MVCLQVLSSQGKDLSASRNLDALNWRLHSHILTVRFHDFTKLLVMYKRMRPKSKKKKENLTEKDGPYEVIKVT